MRALNFLATGAPRIVIEPSWLLRLLAALVFALAVATIYTALQWYDAARSLVDAQANADFWLELSLAPDTQAAVRVEPDGNGFKCSQFNVRREWELAVRAECQRMGELLTLARTTR